MLFRNSRLKIDWANKHIARIKERIASLPNSQTASIEIHPKFGNEVIKHDVTDTNVSTDMALMIGDTVHNLKCALDYAWLQIIEKLAPSAVSDKAKFPIFASRNKLEAALKGIKIDTSSPKLFKFMLDDICPYYGGNDSLWAIHRLNIDDKHRLLLPVIHYVGIEGIDAQDEQGKPAPGGFAPSVAQGPPWFIHMPLGWKVINKGKATIEVIFDQGDPAGRFEVSDALSEYSLVVLGVVELLENFV